MPPTLLAKPFHHEGWVYEGKRVNRKDDIARLAE
jgi:hypothetical protein